MRSSSKNTGSFIELCGIPVSRNNCWSRVALALGLEALRNHLSVSLLQQYLHEAFRLFQLLLALPRKLHAFLKQLHRLVQRKLRALQPPHHFLQPRQRTLKIWLLRRFWFFRYRLIHSVRSSCRRRASARQALTSGTSNNNTSTARSAQSSQSPRRTAGKTLLRAGTPAKYSLAPETTTPHRENPAPDADSILRHAAEPVQSLCAISALPLAKGNWRFGADRAPHATALRRNKYSRCPQTSPGPAKSLSAASSTSKVSRTAPPP